MYKAEQALEDWRDATCSSTKELLQIPKEDIKGISFCSQCSTVVLVEKDGNALRPAMNIMDTRASKQFTEYFGNGLKVAGADFQINGHPWCKFPIPYNYFWRSFKFFTQDWWNIKPMMYAISDGTNQLVVADAIKECGIDIILAAGGGIHGHPAVASAHQPVPLHSQCTGS